MEAENLNEAQTPHCNKLLLCDAPTEKQLTAIRNMMRALGWGCKIPDTKKECSKLIGEMKNEISTRISITGKIGYDSRFDGARDEDYDDDGWE